MNVGLWILILLCDLLIPITMIVFGYILNTKPPKEINGVYGYRTSRSRKNKDTWYFANTYCGKLWWKFGWIMLFGTIVIHLPLVACDDENTISIFVMASTFIQMIWMIGSVFSVEKALKKEFDDNGVRRNNGKTQE